MRLQGKTAIITGAASGMGEAMAKLFAQQGAQVLVTDMRLEDAQRVAAEIKKAGGKALGAKLNVTSQADINNAVQLALKEFSRIDILVNNAGIMDNFKTVTEADDMHWDTILNVNLNGPFKLSRAVIPIMQEQETGGVILNNASIGGLYGACGGAAYVASKHALIGLTKNIAATFGSHGNKAKVRANAIAPGAIETNIGATITAPSPLGLEAISSLGAAPSGQAQDVAQLALYLASDESRFVNGAVITIDGGWTCK
jgi:NAD(P)-dependent dehydrogenase (short-subunit alcohol dehydrogenase family)